MRIYPRVELIGDWTKSSKTNIHECVQAFIVVQITMFDFLIAPFCWWNIPFCSHLPFFGGKNKHVLYRWNRIKYINSNPMNSQIEISFFAPKIFHPKSRQNFPDFSGRQQLLQILGFQTQLPRIGAVQGLHISSEAGRAVVDFYEETGLLYPLVMSK